jgi:hypothetical protein
MIDRPKIARTSHAANVVPALVAAAGERASFRYLEFFAANIRNPNTRWPYGHAVAEFLAWCDDNMSRRSRPCSRFTSPPGSRCSSEVAPRRP